LRFCSATCRMCSSMLPSASSRTTSTFCFWPMRCARACACRSIWGFQSLHDEEEKQEADVALESTEGVKVHMLMTGQVVGVPADHPGGSITAEQKQKRAWFTTTAATRAPVIQDVRACCLHHASWPGRPPLDLSLAAVASSALVTHGICMCCLQRSYA
jgi:hypothetical protein